MTMMLPWVQMMLMDMFALAAQEAETDLVECALIEEGDSSPLALYAFWIYLTIQGALY